MKQTLLLFIVFLFIACNSTKKNSITVFTRSVIESPNTFNYLAYTDTFNLEVSSFIKNNAYCYTEGIPYALIIGHPMNTSALPNTISILARCDNNVYAIGEKIKILPVENPEISSLGKITFVKDTIINNQLMRWQIGSEYPAMWGQVLQRNL